MTEKELLIRSTVDGSLQPSLFFEAEEKGRPLLVGLHTWSYDRHNLVKRLLPYAERYGFNLLCPDFRGPNLNTNPHCTEACGSILARQDIKDAIDEVVARFDVDRQSIYLLGLSGGGHMAMLMAGYCPEYFRAICAVVPISDLCKWHDENTSYRHHIEACCGSNEEMLMRSPISYIDKISAANLKIFHGKWDKVVPVSQSISFYQKMMESYPEAKVYLDIFDGGHEIDMESAFHWFETQSGGAMNNEVTG